MGTIAACYKLEFTQCYTDICLYVKGGELTTTVVVVYVDDLLVNSQRVCVNQYFDDIMYSRQPTSVK